MGNEECDEGMLQKLKKAFKEDIENEGKFKIHEFAFNLMVWYGPRGSDSDWYIIGYF